MVVFLAPAIWCQSLEEAGVDYTTALQKTPGDQRISAFREYVKKYPDANANIFTKLAYYWLTVDFYNTKNYEQAVQHADKALTLGGMEKKLEAGVYLILASSYGVKSFSRYSLDKAMKYADRTIAFARDNGISDIQQQAQALKKELSEPKPEARVLTPTDKINAFYNDKRYDEAISFYNSLGDADKKNQTIMEIYADSLLKANRLDAALEKFNEAYAKQRKGLIAERFGDIYLKKASQDKKLLDKAIAYYIEAGLLFKKEGSQAKMDNCLKNAKYQLSEKYGYNQKAQKFNAAAKKVKAPPDNTKEIKKLELQYRQLERELQKKYPDVEMPDYENEKLEKITQQIEKLQKGATPAYTGPNEEEYQALMKEKEKIDKEFDQLLQQVKKATGL